MKEFKYEVTIVGGGPAGIATALTLQALGISNCILEASFSPKQKYGEALPPNAKPILTQLGILSLVEDDRHIKYYGNKSCWGSNKMIEDHFISDLHGNGFLLDRAFFERQLWGRYTDVGGSLFNGSRLRNIDKNEIGFLLNIDHQDQKISIQSRFVVDATGRKASVSRLLGHNKINLDEQFVLSTIIQNSDNQERQIILEATQNGWWYAAPNGNGDTTLMFFTLKSLIPSKENLSSFMKSNMEGSIHISKLISLLCLSNTDIAIMPAGTSCLAVPYGDNWLAVGDAAYSYDPISSYGVTSALASGYYAGQAITSKLAGKEEAMDAYAYILSNAFQAYKEKLIKHYKSETRWEGSDYWEGRLRR